MRVAIVDRSIDLAALLAEVADPATGAGLLFVGTVRNVNDGRPVSGIEYSAYREMAALELETIAREAVERFDTTHVVVEHRLGVLALGDVSVAIAVAHPHRAAAYDASRYVIEELKRRVPIWKREAYEDGTREWVGSGPGTRDSTIGTRDSGLGTRTGLGGKMVDATSRSSPESRVPSPDRGGQP